MAESKLSIREALKMLHPNAAERVKATRWYTYAAILDHALYGGSVPDKKISTIAMPAGVTIPGVGENQIDLRRVLRELAHECEAMALVEATK